MPLTTVLLLLVGGFDALLVKRHHDGMVRASKLLLSGVAVELDETLAEQADNLKAIESVIIREKALTVALKARDRADLLGHDGPLSAHRRAKHGIRHFYFHGPDRVDLLRVRQPKRNGDIIGRFTWREKGYTGPIIAFTAHAIASDRPKCIDAGCDD